MYVASICLLKLIFPIFQVQRGLLTKIDMTFFFGLNSNDTRTPLNIMASQNLGVAWHTNFANPTIIV
jgi:hypothetical protein